MTATLIEDRNTPGVYRVEAEDDDGGMEVAIFSGPNALDRAIIFAARLLQQFFGEDALENANHSLCFMVEGLIHAARIDAPRRCDTCGEDSNLLECMKCSGEGWNAD